MANDVYISSGGADFKTAFCEAFACPGEMFVEQLFWMSLKPHLRPLARLVRRWSPEFFRADFECLGRVGEATGWREFRAIANNIHADPELNRGFWRRQVGLRISGARLIEARGQVFARRRDALRL